ncbi:MAG TPA: XdhC family protein [Alphaproteobacteria bacterium]|nr:XdhC family protein [Alphaproteobacteria bacterium]
MKRAILDAIRAARRERRSAALVTDLKTGAQALVDSAGRRTGVVEADGEQFVQLFEPSPRLIMVGAVHIAQKLAPIAALAGFDVTIVDPRGAFATEARFPDVRLVNEWPDRALTALGLDTATAVVTLTHDPKVDDPALVAALRSPVFYIGALGSRKTQAKRRDRMKEHGFTDEDLARIHAPVGLSIGAVSPGEIAVSIMAEIVSVRRGRRLVAASQ